MHNSGETALTPDIIGQHQSNRGSNLTLWKCRTISRARTTGISPIREDVHASGNQIRSDAASRRADFDAKAEIIKTDDGTLASKKSLLVQSGKQVGRDTGATSTMQKMW
jgi:conjugal transfer mating pair stabilization protein TraG